MTHDPFLVEIDVSEDMVASVSTSTPTTMYDKIRTLANDYWESHSLIKVSKPQWIFSIGYDIEF